MTAREPTPADVLAELKVMHREVRAQLAELRADWAERWSRTNDRLDEIRERQGTLIDAIAELRSEYAGHHHPHIHGDDGREQGDAEFRPEQITVSFSRAHLADEPEAGSARADGTRYLRSGKPGKMQVSRWWECDAEGLGTAPGFVREAVESATAYLKSVMWTNIMLAEVTP
jgi:hypothetical protein